MLQHPQQQEHAILKQRGRRTNKNELLHSLIPDRSLATSSKDLYHDKVAQHTHAGGKWNAACRFRLALLFIITTMGLYELLYYYYYHRRETTMSIELEWMEQQANRHSLFNDKSTTFQHDSNVCSEHGTLLWDTCFCQSGWTGTNCATVNKDNTTTPSPCGSHGDRCFFLNSAYGVAQISEKHWRLEQERQKNDAKVQQGTTGLQSRNDKHARNFAQYASLVLPEDGNGRIVPAGDTTTLGHVMEVASGPLTNALDIMEHTGLLPQSITLVEPLAETYMKYMKACRYKNGTLTNGKDINIDKTIIWPIPVEQISFHAKGEKYDTLILINVMEHVQDAFLSYASAFDVLKPGGSVIFHERYWPGYAGQEAPNKRDYDLNQIRLNDVFAHWMATEFHLEYEKEQWEDEGFLDYYWIGRKRQNSASMAQNLIKLSKAMERHRLLLQSKGFDEDQVWGNIYNAKDLDQPREYYSYASLPWVKTICEIGFAGGHSTVTYLEANPRARIYSFDDFGKRDLGITAYEVLKTRGNITITIGDSTQEIPRFIGQHPDVFCDVISVDGAHHAHFPDVDLLNFKYLANYPNVVLIDDYHEKDWPAVVTGVSNRAGEGSLRVRHVAKSGVIFRNKEKQWAIGEYTLMTVVVASVSVERTAGLAQLVNEAARHPAVQQVIVLWNTPDAMPKEVQKLGRLPSTPGNTMARITVIQSKTKSPNNRFDPSLPIHTGAVVMLDDDLEVTQETFTCLLNAFKSDPSRVYSFGLKGKVSPVVSMGAESPEAPATGIYFILPRMIFHRSLLQVYHDPVYEELHVQVDMHVGHCDDVAFTATITKHTRKPLAEIDAPYGFTQAYSKGLTGSGNKGKDWTDCAKTILSQLDWKIPLIQLRFR